MQYIFLRLVLRQWMVRALLISFHVPPCGFIVHCKGWCQTHVFHLPSRDIKGNLFATFKRVQERPVKNGKQTSREVTFATLAWLKIDFFEDKSLWNVRKQMGLNSFQTATMPFWCDLRWFNARFNARLNTACSCNLHKAAYSVFYRQKNI